jgi:hypothetical protein
MQITDILAAIPKYLSYGVLGLGAVALVLFLLIGRQSTPILTQVLFVALSLFVVACGAFLEWAKSAPTDELRANACTDAQGHFGQVKLTLDVLNQDLSSNGPTLAGRRFANEPLVSLDTLGFLADPNRTASWPEKRYMTSWDCLVPKPS